MVNVHPPANPQRKSVSSLAAAIEIIDAQDKVIAEAISALEDAIAKVDAQDVRIARQDGDIARLKGDLAALLKKFVKPIKTPKNSSIPPSQAVKPGAAAEPMRQKARFHEGAHRPLCDKPDVVKDMRTDICPHCATDVSGVEQGACETYDHIEIPLAPAVTTRVVLRRGTCPCCNGSFKAAAPQGMEPGSPYGPNLRATVIHLRHAHAVSYERLAVLLEVQFGVKLSEGAIATILKTAASAFETQAQTIRQRLLSSTAIGSDETRFRVNKGNWWLWVFQNADSCFFAMAAGRGKYVVEQFLGDVRPPAWVSDRLGSQCGWGEKHQACLAHLLRDAQLAIDSGDTILAPRVVPLLCRAIRVWRNRERLMRICGPGVLDAFFWRFFLELGALLAEPILANAISEKFRRSLVKWQDNLFVFLTEADVAPTNNASEQALRWSAVFRKVTNCFRSEWGAHLHANIRSVVETARRRGIGALEAIRLTLAGELLPVPA
jgi:transposase